MIGASGDVSSIVSLTVLAGLLSLLPVVILFWVYYLKESKPSIPGRAIARFFAAGMLAVGLAIILERSVYAFSKGVAPAAASALFIDVFHLRDAGELLLALAVAFGVVALVEEGVRYLLLRFLVRRTGEIDQVIDGIQVGVASGLGFAFVENTLYFLRLFQGFEFNTLVVVFFLRFLISTFGHITFGGVMGYQLARALADPVEQRKHRARAFWMPWLMHGLFDFLLSVRLSAYTVLFLLLPVFALWAFYRSPQLAERFRLHGRFLRASVRGRPRLLFPWRRPPVEILPWMPWCPICFTSIPDLSQGRSSHGGRGTRVVDQRCLLCGALLHGSIVTPTHAQWVSAGSSQPR